MKKTTTPKRISDIEINDASLAGDRISYLRKWDPVNETIKGSIVVMKGLFAGTWVSDGRGGWVRAADPRINRSAIPPFAAPRYSGWTGKSPAKRSRIKLGEFLAGPGKIIISRRNLRSELERIFAEADAGLDIEKIEIWRP